MKKIIKPIERIAIEKEKIVIYPEKGTILEFPRSKTWLFVNDVKQVQDITSYTLLLFEDGVGCEVEEDRGKIFCGKKPEEVRIL